MGVTLQGRGACMLIASLQAGSASSAAMASFQAECSCPPLSCWLTRTLTHLTWCGQDFDTISPSCTFPLVQLSRAAGGPGCEMAIESPSCLSVVKANFLPPLKLEMPHPENGSIFKDYMSP